MFEIRNANGNYEHMDRGAGEVVSLNVDVIVATSTYAARAAQKATAKIPIVFVNVSDPIAAGFASTLARPGANMTGISIITGELNRKRLELLKLAIPHLSHIAWLVNPDNPYIAAQVPQMHSAAGGIGVKLVVANWNTVDDFDAVLSKLTGERAKAITLSADPLYTDHVRQIVDTTMRYRVALMTPTRRWTEAGALISYGADGFASYRQAAIYVDKILKGTKPADLPIEQPTKFDLVVNLKAAKALGITISQSLLQRADEVIQ